MTHIITDSRTGSNREFALVYDTEANGFVTDGLVDGKFQKAGDIMWCLCAKDMITGRRWEWGGPEGLFPHRNEIRQLIRHSRTLVAHNQIKHDLAQLYKLGIVSPEDWWDAKIIDTFTVSTLLNPDRQRPVGLKGKAGPHGLEAWGVRAGRLKPEQEQWAVWEPSMLHRCREDVEINEFAFLELQKESKQDAWQWQVAMDVEHKQAFIIAEQERAGWHFYREKAQGFIDDFTEKIADIDKVLVPLMPPKVVFNTPLKDVFKKDGNYTASTCKWFGCKSEDAKSETPPVGKPPIAANYFVKQLDDTVRPATIEEIKAWPEKKVGIVNRCTHTLPNPGSDDQIKDYLISLGWQCDEHTDGGAPKFTESSLETDHNKQALGENGHLAAKRKVLQSRLSQLQGWMENVRPDGRITANCNPCGAVTGRARHKTIVNVPRTTSDYGHEMRSVFGVPDLFCELGYDASGLELRCLAHYMEDPEYIRQLLEGDIHTVNMIAAGLSSRDQAKTFIYALLYGAGDLKIGRIVGGNSTQGKELKAKFFANIPSLGRLLNKVRAVAQRGYIRGIDGRKLFVRSDHAALNTLLQSAGAIVMKYAMIVLDDWLAAEGFKHPSRRLADIYCNPQHVMKVGDIHDEGQLQMLASLVTDRATFKGTDKEAAKWMPDQRVWSAPRLISGSKKDGGEWERVYCRPGELAVHAVREAGRQLQFNCPLDGEYKVGKSWADCH